MAIGERAQIWTDGSHNPMTGCGGWGSIVSMGQNSFERHGALIPCGSSLEAELAAVMRTTEALVMVYDTLKSIVVWTDHEGIVKHGMTNAMESDPTWKVFRSFLDRYSRRIKFTFKRIPIEHPKYPVQHACAHALAATSMRIASPADVEPPRRRPWHDALTELTADIVACDRRDLAVVLAHAAHAYPYLSKPAQRVLNSIQTYKPREDTRSWFTVGEVAQQLELSPADIRRAIRSGHLKAEQVDAHLKLVSAREVERYRRRSTSRPS